MPGPLRFWSSDQTNDSKALGQNRHNFNSNQLEWRGIWGIWMMTPRWTCYLEVNDANLARQSCMLSYCGWSEYEQSMHHRTLIQKVPCVGDCRLCWMHSFHTTPQAHTKHFDETSPCSRALENQSDQKQELPLAVFSKTFHNSILEI